MCDQQTADSGPQTCVYRAALEAIDEIDVNDFMDESFGFGRSVLTVDGVRLARHIAGIVHPVLHGTDADGKPLPAEQLSARG